MPKKFFIALYSLLAVALSSPMASCTDDTDFNNSAYSNFDALAYIIDTHYCFFEEKDLDWQEITFRYREKIKPGMTYDEYFRLCSDMLDELKDGHVNLTSSFNTSYYRKWWSDYPQDFNIRTIEENYLDFDWDTTSGIMYKKLGSAGYMYYPSFSNTISDSGLDNILYSFSDCDALIIDIRNNGGGLLTNVTTLVSRFINDKICGGYIRHKTGPGHSDFSEPFPIEYSPAPSPRIHWEKPVYILTNRSSFSAANNFVAVMKALPQVIIVGARTGGGGGLPFTSELPIGWSVRFSASPVTDADGLTIEWGIDPTEGFECHSPEAQLAEGKDAILDLTLSHIDKTNN